MKVYKVVKTVFVVEAMKTFEKEKVLSTSATQEQAEQQLEYFKRWNTTPRASYKIKEVEVSA